MLVSLSIENDAEFRNYIKACINTQVLSIIREDFKEMVRKELERKLNGTNKQEFEAFVKSALHIVISNILYKEHHVENWGEIIQSSIEKHIISAIKGKNWNKLIDDLAKEKIKSIFP